MIIENYGCAFEVNNNPKYNNFWMSHFSSDWERDTFSFLSEHLQGDKTFIDIGAWIGPIAIPAALCSKQCICFEPDSVAYEELMKNIELNNLTNVIVEKKGVSVRKNIWLGADELGESITNDRNTNNSFLVECMTVEEIFNKYNLTERDVSIIKIDIEGHESELLQDEFLMNLNIPMHISLHFEFAPDKEVFKHKIDKFLRRKNIDINTLNTYRNISIEIL